MSFPPFSYKRFGRGFHFSAKIKNVGWLARYSMPSIVLPPERIRRRLVRSNLFFFISASIIFVIFVPVSGTFKPSQ